MESKYLKPARDFVATLESTTAWDAIDAENAFIAGAEYAETHLWTFLSHSSPMQDDNYLTLICKGENKIVIEVAPWRGGKYQGTCTMEVNLRMAHVIAWMPIPVINLTDEVIC